MAPAIYRSSRSRRQPLVPASPVPLDPSQLVANIQEIMNNSQHPGTTAAALEDLKRLYKNSETDQFQDPFVNCVRKLLQSEHNCYFKAACSCICKFLQFVSKESDEARSKNENSSPKKRVPAIKKKTQKQPKKTKQTKRLKRDDSESEDELLAGVFKKTSIDEESMDSETASPLPPETTITEHDQLISACADVAGLYRQAVDETSRLNAVYFIFLLLSNAESLDEGICDAIKQKMLKSIRDKKPNTRAFAALALRTFQEDKLTQEAFRYHFDRDPEPIVRKHLLQIMDTKVFGYDFLVSTTQDPREYMRKIAYRRFNAVEPKNLSTQQLHCVIHNGLNERDLTVATTFERQTLWPWIAKLYDGIDLHKLLEAFDVVNYADDINCLLTKIYFHDRAESQGNGTSTKLHHLVERFRESWLNDNTRLPNVEKVDEQLVVAWFSLVNFCKKEATYIEKVVIRMIQPEDAANESIEHILESQETEEESIDLYERLCPDLVNLVEFLNNYIRFVAKQLDDEEIDPEKAEFTYLQIIEYITTLEVGDELERKTVQEVFDTILKESLLVRHFENFITPLLRCLYRLVYSRSSNLMVNYISELIQNERSHLEDISQPTETTSTEPIPIFTSHPFELIKCLQMYLGCLQNARVTEVPETMLSHLKYLSFESLESPESAYRIKIMSLMVACNGVTGLVDKNFIRTDEACLTLLAASCHDEIFKDKESIGFMCLVDVVCQHDDIELPEESEDFMITHLKRFHIFKANESRKKKLEFITAVIEGTTKLFYLQKLKSPYILAYLIIWWYHPNTPSKLKQFIGIFLPTFVNDLSNERHVAELLMDTFVISLEIFHDYILGPGYNIMAATDITNLISYMSNLIPVSLHPGIATRIDDKLSELDSDERSKDLAKYLRMFKTSN